jgi:hypothetical protein
MLQHINERMAESGFDPATGLKAGQVEDPPQDEVVDDDGGPAGETTPGSEDQGSEQDAQSSERDQESGTQGEAEGEGEAEADGGTEEPPAGEESGDEELVLDDGTPDMPLKERKKLLLKDYQKKTTALKKGWQELEDYREGLVKSAESLRQQWGVFEQAAAEVQQPRQNALPPVAQMRPDQKMAFYQSIGLDVDETTDPNILRVIDFTVSQMQGVQQNFTSLTRREQQRIQAQLDAQVKQDAQALKTRYDELSKKHKFPPEAELVVLAILNNMRKYHRPDYSMDEAVKDYLDGRGIPADPGNGQGAVPASVPRTPKHPIIPSAKTGGVSTITPAKPASRETFKTIEDAAARAKHDMERRILRHSRR